MYRRDEIDASHYPIFHQMEGVRMFSDQDLVTIIHRCIQHHKDGNVTIIGDDIDVLQQVFDIHRRYPASDQEVMRQLTPTMKKVLVKIDLKELLYGLSSHLFGTQISKRWREDYFPFTIPSYELDIQFLKEKREEGGVVPVRPTSAEDIEEEKWLEVLGCGIIHDDVIQTSKAKSSGDVRIHDYGWAFGLGLERLAMVLFAIPDIRLFW